MKKTYEALSADLVKFEAEDVITVSAPNENEPNEPDNSDAAPTEVPAER